MVSSNVGVIIMTYYTIKAGTTAQTQIFDVDGQLIDEGEVELIEDETFNETQLFSEWKCSCCNKTVMEFYSGASVAGGMTTYQFLVVEKKKVSAATRSASPQKRADNFANA